MAGDSLVVGDSRGNRGPVVEDNQDKRQAAAGTDSPVAAAAVVRSLLAGGGREQSGLAAVAARKRSGTDKAPGSRHSAPSSKGYNTRHNPRSRTTDTIPSRPLLV